MGSLRPGRGGRRSQERGSGDAVEVATGEGGTL